MPSSSDNILWTMRSVSTGMIMPTHMYTSSSSTVSYALAQACRTLTALRMSPWESLRRASLPEGVMLTDSASMMWSRRAEMLGVERGENRNLVVRDWIAGESLLM